MTILINFFGQPSCGKSTTASDLCTRLKYCQKNVENVLEWTKWWAYSNHKITKFDQYYIFGKETQNQSRLFNKVEYIISDSPVYLTAFYQQYYTGKSGLTELVKEFYKSAEEEDIQIYNFYLKRNKSYNSVGRYQTAEEAEKVGEAMLKWIIENKIPYTMLDCPDAERAGVILKILGV